MFKLAGYFDELIEDGEGGVGDDGLDVGVGCFALVQEVDTWGAVSSIIQICGFDLVS